MKLLTLISSIKIWC